MTAPLEGLVVADFSRVLAGPLATSMLADLGATVIKVERPGVGDDTRSWGPPWTATSSSYFECANRTKKSIQLDLRDPSDQAVAKELARRCDVLVQNFRTGTLDRFGLGYAEVARQNPGVVYCSISGFGSGKGADLPGYDFVVQAMGGLMSITGPTDGQPTKVGVALVDVLTGKDAVIAVQAALAERARSGLGQHVEVNLLSTLLAALANQASAYLATGVAPSRMGNQHPSIAPYETLKCQDGLIALACGNDAQFRRLAAALGLDRLADDERFATNPARVTNRAALVATLESVLGTEDASHWQRVLGAADIPIGAVADIGAAIERAQELGLDPVVNMGEGRPPQVRHPISFSRSVVTPPAAPPSLGQHDEEVRRWLEDGSAS